MSPTKSSIPRPDADTLRRLYLEQGLGCPEIARLFERDAKTAYYWLQQAGIPTRPRGADERQHFKKGAPGAFKGRRHTPEAIAKVKAATAAQGRVPYRRNGKHWLVGLPPNANPNWKGGATPERQEFYRSTEWKRVALLVWRRANACCERCGLDSRKRDTETSQKFHIHHVVSFAVRELRVEPTNLVLLCPTCHYFVHSSKNVGREFLATLPAAEQEASTPSLFDLLDDREAA